ncbi:MAG: DUF1801 domain-containing protein [Gammaproteobacteria bacterium]|nr:DUF1801 domain-containing protein [Gammaproteobacteria bacterium]
MRSSKKPRRFKNPEVAAVFKNYPPTVRTKLMCLRQLIFDTAAATAEVGELEETLKWGQPSYLTTQSKSGSLIRIDQIKTGDGDYALYFHCQTTLVDTFKEMYREKFKFAGNRSILFNVGDKIPLKELRQCISLALTYHRDKR